MSVRLTNRWHVRKTLLKRPGEYGSSARNRKETSSDDTLAKLVYWLRANTSRCLPMNGVRKNTTRGVSIDGPFARTKPGDAPRDRSFLRQQCRRTRRERDQPARHSRKRMQPDEEYVGFPRQLGSRAHRNWTRHGATSHQPASDCGQMDGTHTNATVRKRGAHGDAGHHRSSVEPHGTTGRRPRRGTRPREGRPTNVLIRRAMVHTRQRSKASRDQVPSVRQER